MTLIAMLVFGIPFIGLCAFILGWGIVDVVRKRKAEKSQDATPQ